MKLFADSANIAELESVLTRGLVRGVTTNPTTLKAETAGDPVSHLRKIVGLLEKDGREFPLSVQVMARTPDEMSRHARVISDALGYKSLIVKIPCEWDSLRVIHDLTANGAQVNATACMTVAQGLLAAQAGARYVSFFAGKMSDAGMDPRRVIADTAPLIQEHGTEIIVGSLRRAYDVTDFASAGAHVVTVPPRFFGLLAEHPKTAEAVDLFAECFLPLS
ncbi:transaldolase family protein [Nonomuraea sp. NPDC050153]|uniref:transaldolase family protein n=1 Tax=Nonomuraea sp. NPDC050153 TaxID=3364359 RepID=UPI0037A0CF4E